MAKKQDDMLDSVSKVKLTGSDYVIRGIGYVFISLFAIASIFPFLIILGTSFETEENIIAKGVTLIPRNFTTAAYDLVIKGGTIWASYGLTIVLTVTGTLIGLFICSMTGYALQRLPLPQRHLILRLFHQPLPGRPCSVLPAHDAGLSPEQQLLGRAPAADGFFLADHPDEELCQVCAA